MKPRLAAILSIAGVLSAGSAAALVNTQVLETDGGATNAAPATVPGDSASSVPGSASVPSTSGTTIAAASSTSPTTVVASGTVVPPTVPAASPVAETPSSAPAPTGFSQPPATNPAAPSIGVYQLGDGGSVTLSTAGDTLTIISVDPAPGWSVKDAKHEDAHNIEVRLRSDDREVRFKANLLYGVVGTSLRTDDD